MSYLPTGAEHDVFIHQVQPELLAGTTIAANGYLIFWADEDGVDGPEHCNFKLVATGETIYLTNTNLLVQDQVTFGAQTADKAYARSPSSTGNFVVQGPTFNANNNTSATNDPAAADDGFRIVPNPAAGRAYLRLESVKDNDNFVVRDIHGRIFQEGQPTSLITAIDVAAWSAGVYIMQYGQSVRKLIVQ